MLTLALGRAWRAGAGPGKGPVTLDVDSTICAVSGKPNKGPPMVTPKSWVIIPLLAFRADTGEVVGARLREGSSQRGVVHFVGETIRRVRRAGARSLLIIGFGELAVLVWWGWLGLVGWCFGSVGDGGGVLWGAVGVFGVLGGVGGPAGGGVGESEVDEAS